MESQAALATGCSTGIGSATATTLAAAGYEVLATARKPEELTIWFAVIFGLNPDASLEEIRSVVDRYSVFRIVDAGAQGAGLSHGGGPD